jgi:hypothetical protein
MIRTNGDGLDLDAILDVGTIGIVRLLVRQDALAAEGVDEGGSACSAKVYQLPAAIACGWIHPQCIPGRRGDDLPVPDAPHTIKQNWIPFLTFFFLRIIFCSGPASQRRIL